MINEITILIVACLLFIFTDIGKNRSARVNGSWAIIGVVVANIVFNIVKISIASVRGCISKLKQRKREKGSYVPSPLFWKRKSSTSDSGSRKSSESGDENKNSSSGSFGEKKTI